MANTGKQVGLNCPVQGSRWLADNTRMAAHRAFADLTERTAAHRDLTAASKDGKAPSLTRPCYSRQKNLVLQAAAEVVISLSAAVVTAGLAE